MLRKFRGWRAIRLSRWIDPCSSCFARIAAQRQWNQRARLTEGVQQGLMDTLERMDESGHDIDVPVWRTCAAYREWTRHGCPCKKVIDSFWTRGLRCPPVLRRKTIAVLSGAMACSAFLSACSQPAAVSATGKAGTTEPASAEGSVTSETRAVLQAWRAAEMAFHDAAETSDPSLPALSSTMVDPQLSRARQFLGQMRQAGDVATGPTGLGDPKVVSIVGGRAVVVSCIDDRAVEVDEHSGHPIPGVLGEVAHEEVTSQEALTGSGWRLADQSVAVGACGK